jgi:hypothetical protein
MRTSNGTCPTCGYKQKRSNPQNKRYWELLHLISENIRLENGTFSPESWHKYFCMRFIGCEEFKLPSGEIILQPMSSSALDVAQFNVFTTNAEVWAAEQGVYLPDLEEAA